MTKQNSFIKWFAEVGIADVPQVGGKNASLGEMLKNLSTIGINVPNGFATTASAFRYYIDDNNLAGEIRNILGGLNKHDVNDLSVRAKKIRDLIYEAKIPEDLQSAILDAYQKLSAELGMDEAYVAVRSSATAEDLPNASFAGQQESFLMVHGEGEVLDTVKQAFASLFTARAISYREDMGFDHFDVALSVGIQHMVRSDISSSGVIFSLDPETGFDNVIYINSIWGLGENIVQGKVTPDAFYVHKAKLKEGYDALFLKQIGSKELTLSYDFSGHRLSNNVTSEHKQNSLSLTDEEVLQLARWTRSIEDHYSETHQKKTPMDIEWAKDGITGELYIVQARPETVHSQRSPLVAKIYSLKETGKVLAEGIAIGGSIATGITRLIQTPHDMDEFQEGEVLVTEITDPDWEPIMKKASAIITERGGRTSHAAIVARELGVPAIVGVKNGLETLTQGSTVTISTAEGEVGKIYEGYLDYDVQEVDLLHLEHPKVDMMLNISNPDRAFQLAMLPIVRGVGLARLEFIFANEVGIHPMALVRYDAMPAVVKREIDAKTVGYRNKKQFCIDKLAQGIGTIAAAFWPRPVILRLSDFKSNEYAHLIGGEQFEPKEANPMLGWRGASRYYHPEYQEAFLLEVEAIKKVRQTFGLSNLKIMVPFCRTVQEGKKVLEVLADNGLVRGEDHLKVYVMAELPSNILDADGFAEIFDGFSIGSNDLTQLVLGVDRDSEVIHSLFDERDSAVKKACSMLIQTAHNHGCEVGICGQAPSDYPEFADFLVGEGISYISLNADALMSTSQYIVESEKKTNEFIDYKLMVETSN